MRLNTQHSSLASIKALAVTLTLIVIAHITQAADNTPHNKPAAPRADVLLTKKLQGIEGKESVVLTVDLPPGAESPPHKHNANTFVYVLEGSIVMQVKGGEPVTLKVGQTFYELPTDVHVVSKNASKTAPAKFVVFMVKDVDAPLSVPAK